MVVNQAVLSKADGLSYRSTRVAAIAWVGQVERECARHSWRGSCAIEDRSSEFAGACGGEGGESLPHWACPALGRYY